MIYDAACEAYGPDLGLVVTGAILFAGLADLRHREPGLSQHRMASPLLAIQHSPILNTIVDLADRLLDLDESESKSPALH